MIMIRFDRRFFNKRLPSHTHLDELYVYEEDQLDRMVFYHLANLDQVKEVEQAGYRVALPGKRFTL
tara:strand:- start:1632 stop:1829 length:198 start_codon:yes stop_codon:yes gene_type:complete